MENQKKFGAVDIVIGGFITIFIDVIAGLLDLTGMGYIVAVPLQAATSFATTMWIKAKGGERAWALEKQITKQGANFLPVSPIVITTFTCSIAFFIEVFLHNKGIGKLANIGSGSGVSDTIKKN